MALNQTYTEDRTATSSAIAPKRVQLFDDIVNWIDSVLQLNALYNPEIALAIADGAKFIEENVDLPYMFTYYVGLYAGVQGLGKTTGGGLTQGSDLWFYPNAVTLPGGVGAAFATGGVVKAVENFEIRPEGLVDRKWRELRKLDPFMWPQVRRSSSILPDANEMAIPTYYWPVNPYTVRVDSPSDANYDTRVTLVVFTDPFPEGVQQFTPAGFHPLFNEFRGLLVAEAIHRMIPIVRDAGVAQYWGSQKTDQWKSLHTRLDAFKRAEVQPPIGFSNWEGSVDA